MARTPFQIKPFLRKHWPLAAMALACVMMLTAIILVSSGAVAMETAALALRGDRSITALSAQLDGQETESDAAMVETIAASSFGGGFIRDDRVTVYLQPADAD